MNLCGLCQSEAEWVCTCSRCHREPDDEKFFACQEHLDKVATSHARIRGRNAAWSLTPKGAS